MDTTRRGFMGWFGALAAGLSLPATRGAAVPIEMDPEAVLRLGPTAATWEATVPGGYRYHGRIELPEPGQTYGILLGYDVEAGGFWKATLVAPIVGQHYTLDPVLTRGVD